MTQETKKRFGSRNTHLREVKSYKTILGSGVTLNIVLFQLASKFGVLIRQPGGAICAPNYQNQDDSMLRTYQGNEMGVIDWVSLEEANKRFSHLIDTEGCILKVEQQITVNTKNKVPVPHLRLVHGGKNGF